MADDHAPGDRQVDDLAVEGPLQRWSRRKRMVAGEDAAPSPAAVSEEVAPGESCADGVDLPATPGEAPPKTDADMPPVAVLDADSPLGDFFSPGVSEDLRRQALRRVFSQPRFNVTDGLDDYAEDYTRYRPLGDLVTAGLRWYRQRQAELAAERAERAELDIDAPPADASLVEVEEVEEDGRQAAERIASGVSDARTREGEAT